MNLLYTLVRHSEGDPVHKSTSYHRSDMSATSSFRLHSQSDSDNPGPGTTTVGSTEKNQMSTVDQLAAMLGKCLPLPLRHRSPDSKSLCRSTAAEARLQFDDLKFSGESCTMWT